MASTSSTTDSISSFIDKHYNIIFQGTGVDDLNDVREFVLLMDGGPEKESDEIIDFHNALHKVCCPPFGHAKVHAKFLNLFAQKEDVLLIDGTPGMQPIEEGAAYGTLMHELKPLVPDQIYATKYHESIRHFPNIQRIVEFGLWMQRVTYTLHSSQVFQVEAIVEQILGQLNIIAATSEVDAEELAKYRRLLLEEFPLKVNALTAEILRQEVGPARVFTLVSSRFWRVPAKTKDGAASTEDDRLRAALFQKRRMAALNLSLFFSLRNCVVLSPKKEVAQALNFYPLGMVTNMINQAEVMFELAWLRSGRGQDTARVQGL